jgi:hypothetical protein
MLKCVEPKTEKVSKRVKICRNQDQDSIDKVKCFEAETEDVLIA